MNFLKNESRILNIIKYSPIVFVLILSLIITQIFIQQKNENLTNEIKAVKKVFHANNKKRVKEEINRIINNIKEEKDNFEESLKIEIKNRVYEAHQIATNIFIQESKLNGTKYAHSKEQIFHTIKTALGGIIFNQGRGYFFIADVQGRSLLQPLNPKFEDKNLLNYKDANGYIFAQKMVDTIKKKSEAYDTYYWYKGKDKVNNYKKISFYKYFEPYNIVIGSGEYIDDFEKELKIKLLKKIQKIRYGDNGYIFVYDEIGNLLSHFKKELIGTNRLDVQDEKGNYVIQNVLNFAQYNKEGFIPYTANMKPHEIKKSREKISYVKLFEDWGWVIGTGFYLDKLDEEILKKENSLKVSNEIAIQNILLISLIVTFIFIIISFYISKLIGLMFNEYNDNIEKEITKTIEKEKLLVQQSKMASMGEMIGNIAHQWKQPLSIISMSNGLLRLNHESEMLSSKKDIDTAMNNIDNSISNLSQTIDDFRNFFNPNKEQTLFKISDAFNQTIKLFSSQLKNRNIEIIKNIKEVELIGSQNELQQTLINLLKNATEELIKKSSKEKRFIFINTFKENDSLIIKIKDNANGIPIDILDKVFDSYFTTKENEGGSGIGLYMSKQIITEHMKGTITASNVKYTYENEDYVGAEFSISIPLTNK